MLTLHSFWRSSASHRARLMLNLKGLDYDIVAHNLRKSEQRSEAYLRLNPHGLVPALEGEGQIITQTLAIMEWLEARYPTPPLMPQDESARAVVRSMCAHLACEIQPLQNLRVLNHLRATFGADDDMINTWVGHWILEGFRAMEVLIERHGAGFCFGASATYADCFLVPQVTAARRFKVDLTPFPRIAAVDAACAALSPVERALPHHQPDFDPAVV